MKIWPSFVSAGERAPGSPAGPLMSSATNLLGLVDESEIAAISRSSGASRPSSSRRKKSVTFLVCFASVGGTCRPAAKSPSDPRISGSPRALERKKMKARAARRTARARTNAVFWDFMARESASKDAVQPDIIDQAAVDGLGDVRLELLIDQLLLFLRVRHEGHLDEHGRAGDAREDLEPGLLDAPVLDRRRRAASMVRRAGPAGSPRPGGRSA